MATVNVGTILTANVGTWNNGENYNCYPQVREWQWTRDGVDIPGMTSGTYTTSNTDIGKTIALRETVRFLGENNDGYSTENTSPRSSSTSAGHNVVGAVDPTLIYADNMVYLGAFTVGNASNGSVHLGYGGLGLAFNANGTGSQKTLMWGATSGYIKGAREINIATPSLISTQTYGGAYSSLPAAAGINPVSGPISDITEGGYAATGMINSQIPEMRGMLHVNNTTKMLVTGDVRYQNEPPYAAMWRRPWDLSITGQVEGPVTFYDTRYAPRANLGWLCNIPSDPVNGVNYQTALGCDMLSGLSGLSIVANWASASPSISCFKYSDFDVALSRKVTGNAVSNTSNTLVLGSEADGKVQANDWITCLTLSNYSQKINSYNVSTRTVTVSGTPFSTTATGTLQYFTTPRANCTQLSFRPYTAPLDDSTTGYTPIGTNPFINGAVIPNGTKSLLCFGSNNDGKYTYGAPGLIEGGIKIWDPENGAKGGHAFPSFTKVWAYNLDELVKVKNGTGGYTELNVKPYGVWNIPAPPLYGMRSYQPTGVAYDPSTKRLYITTGWGATEGNPYGGTVVLVYEVTNAV